MTSLMLVTMAEVPPKVNARGLSIEPQIAMRRGLYLTDIARATRWTAIISAASRRADVFLSGSEFEDLVKRSTEHFLKFLVDFIFRPEKKFCRPCTHSK